MSDLDKKKIGGAEVTDLEQTKGAVVHTPGSSLDGAGLTSEKALSKTGGAEISFFYFQKYEEELRRKNDEFIKNLESQRKDFQQQLSSEREKALERLDEQRKALVNQISEQRDHWEKKLQDRENEINKLNDTIVGLSISNGFCKSLRGVNIIGAALTLLGTVGASLSATNDIIWLVITLSIVAVVGALFPQIVTRLSEVKNNNK